MQHLPSLVVMQRAIRHNVCTQCFLRPSGSEKLGSDQPRACEPDCQIFVNLPRLREIAGSVDSPTLGAYEHAIKEVVCQRCQADETSGDFCAERTTRDCPLARYMGDVVSTLGKIPQPTA